MRLISCKNLTIEFFSKKVVENVSFDIDEGDYVAIVGENGAGKTSLMKAILGLERPAAGEVRFENGFRLSDCGYLPQRADVQRDFPASVEEIVMSVARRGNVLRPFASKEEREMAERAMQTMGISGISSRPFRVLSGGQQQRVLIARAFCASKKMLFLDEPATALDEKSAAEMFAAVDRLNQNGVAIVMISHDCGTLLKRANKALKI